MVGYDKAKAKGEGETFSWKVITYKAILGDGSPLWPSWFGHKEMERKKKFYTDSGQPYKFYQEYMMEVQSEEDSIFSRRHIRYWDGKFNFDENAGVPRIIKENGDTVPVNVFAGVDPATDSVRRDSDFSVICFVAVDPDNNVYVLDYIRYRSLPVLGIQGDSQKGIVDYMFDYNKIYHPSLYTVEDTSMSKPIFQSLISEMRRRNDFTVKYNAEKPGTRMSKRDRIQEILAQRFAIGTVYLKKTHYDLEREIITFGPRMAHDDCIDALAYACKYAHPPNNIGEGKSGYYKKKPKAKSWITA